MAGLTRSSGAIGDAKSESSMPQIVVEEIMRRASDDPSFRELLLECRRAVLDSYVLTPRRKPRS
jgi:hypothetical protein